VLKKRNIDPQRYEIVEIPDIFDAKKWVNHVVSTVGEFNVVYSNSDWVRNLFLNKGYKLGGKLEIFKKKYNGTNVRKLISRNDKKWTTLVPQEVVSLIRDFDGIVRIKELYKAEKN
jgi:nicotinamide-nucleotide adenylyltransferase